MATEILTNQLGQTRIRKTHAELVAISVAKLTDPNDEVRWEGRDELSILAKREETGEAKSDLARVALARYETNRTHKALIDGLFNSIPYLILTVVSFAVAEIALAWLLFHRLPIA